MGFFKKIGSAVKKGLKQVSLKNVVKLGTPLLSMVPIAGGLLQNTVQGMSDAHEMKKQAKALEEQGKLEEAQAMQAQADYLAKQSGANVGQVAGKTLKAFTKGATAEFVASVPQAVNSAGAQVGVPLVDATLKEWFKKHWVKIAVGLVAIVGTIIIWKKRGNSPKRPLKGRK